MHTALVDKEETRLKNKEENIQDPNPPRRETVGGLTESVRSELAVLVKKRQALHQSFVGTADEEEKEEAKKISKAEKRNALYGKTEISIGLSDEAHQILRVRMACIAGLAYLYNCVLCVCFVFG